MDVSTGPVVVAPGVGGSGPRHWQSLWLPGMAGAVRTAPRSWDAPDREDWVASLDRAEADLGGPPVLVVAHSLGCRAAVLWAERSIGRVAGIFCVAPPDVAGMARAGVVGFDDADRARPAVPVLLVSSTDDPYAPRPQPGRSPRRGGASHVELDALGHVDADSGLGRRQQGRQLMTAFATGLRGR